MSTTERTIRFATVNDAAGIINIFDQNVIKDFSIGNQAPLESKGFLVYGFTPEELALTIKDNSKNLALVMTEQNNIIGYALSYDLQNLNPKWINHFSGLEEIKKILNSNKVLYHRQIAKKRNTKNVGKPLLNFLIKEATKKGYEYIVCQIVHAPILNRISISVHEQFGFLTVGSISEENLTLGVYLKRL